MKILQLNDNIEFVGGTEKTFLKEAEWFHKNGDEVIVAYGGKHVEKPQHYENSYWLPEIDLARVSRNNKRLLADLRDIVEEENPDVIHIRTQGAFGISVELARVKPVVRTIHTPWMYCPVGTKFFPGLPAVCDSKISIRCVVNNLAKGCGVSPKKKRYPLLPFLRRLLACGVAMRSNGRLSRLIVTSEYMKNMLVQAGHRAGKIALIAPPVDVPPEHSLGTAHDSRILFVGRLQYFKGVEHLIRAITRVRLCAGLTIVGDGPERKNLESSVSSAGLADRIEFCGWVDYQEISRYYAASDVLVMPSLWPEAFGNVGVEALAHALPVVAYKCGGIPEWLIDDETGYLARYGDVNDLATKIEWCLRDREKSRDMGRRGRKRVKELYSNEVHMKRTLDLYQEVIRDFKKE